MIGFIGTGLMGFPMAQRLLSAGYPLMVYNRTRAKAEPLQAEGALLAETPGEVFSRCDIIFLMLTDGPAVKEVLSSIPRVQFSGKMIVQMGTILPEESLEFARTIEDAGGEYLEAPVLGSTPEASSGRLIVLVGGSREQYQQMLPYLRLFGPEPFFLGEIGKAATTKLALNQLIVTLITAFSISLGMVQAGGGDVELFMRILRQSALYAPMFDKKLERMLNRDFRRPNFPVKHLLKDVRLIIKAAQHVGISTEVLQSIQDILQQAVDAGWQDLDYSAIFQVLARGERL